MGRIYREANRLAQRKNFPVIEAARQWEYSSRGSHERGLALRSTLHPHPALAPGGWPAWSLAQAPIPSASCGVWPMRALAGHRREKVFFPRLPPCRAALGLRTSAQKVTASQEQPAPHSPASSATSGFWFPLLLSPWHPKEGRSRGIAVLPLSSRTTPVGTLHPARTFVNCSFSKSLLM